jgi:RimJ/RimL family protein N-acetyltransferase
VPAAPALRLRPASSADLPWLRAMTGHERSAPYLAFGAADAYGAPGEVLDETVVALDAGGVPVGAARLVVTNARSRIVAIRTLVVDPAARGRGLGVAVVRAVVAHVISEQGMHRVEAEVLGRNAAGRRTFAAAGFTQEGVRRRAYDRGGEWQDGVHFGLLADEAAGP